MPAPDIILGKGQVLITQSTSGLGIIPLNKSIGFGLVAAVYDTSDKTTVGSSIMYDTTKAQQFMYGSTIYLLIDEQFISGTEVLPP